MVAVASSPDASPYANTVHRLLRSCPAMTYSPFRIEPDESVIAMKPRGSWWIGFSKKVSVTASWASQPLPVTITVSPGEYSGWFVETTGWAEATAAESAPRTSARASRWAP